MDEAMTKLEEINKVLDEGGVVTISTYTRSTQVDAATREKFSKANHPIFKASGNSLFMASGKKYVCIDYCAIKLFRAI